MHPTTATHLSHIDSIRLLKIKIRNRVDYRASYKPTLYRYREVWEKKKKKLNKCCSRNSLFSLAHFCKGYLKQVHGVPSAPHTILTLVQVLQILARSWFPEKWQYKGDPCIHDMIKLRKFVNHYQQDLDDLEIHWVPIDGQVYIFLLPCWQGHY